MLVIQPRVSLVCVLLLIVAAAGAVSREGVKVDLYVTVPQDTPADAKVYICGNLPEVGAWQPPGVPLKRLDDGTWHVDLRLPRGELLEYKITRGSWETVEKGPGGEELHNRTLKLEADTTERHTVARWRSGDAPTTRESTITGDVRIHPITSKHLGNTRRLLVWLPPGYAEDGDRRYPVLYMHDGQNLFDDATSFAGEWKADETAQRLIEAGKIEPIIIVGIENTPQRVDEYTPIRAGEVGGRGEQYARFVIEEVKPLIDRTYRTKPDAPNTAVAGSSLGGVISIYMIHRRGDVFGRCGAVSPSLWWGDGAYLRQIRSDPSFARGKRLWLDMGGRETADEAKARAHIADCASFADALTNAGLKPGRDFAWKVYEDAEHNEQAWSERFDDVLIFLFGER